MTTDPLMDLLLAHGGREPSPGGPGGRVVVRSDDFERVDALPRRDEARIAGAFPRLRGSLAWLKTPQGGMDLRDIQVRALGEALLQGGLFGAIGVGRGKTLIAQLLPTVLKSERAVVLTAPGLVKQFWRDAARNSEHFRIKGPGLTVVPYSKLSVASGATVLEDLQPDLVIADEAHHLRRLDSARTRRFLRYFAAHPGTRFCCMSGTITARSLRDYAHLAALALGQGAPVPLDARTLDAWARALDEGVEPSERFAPGVLLDWCAPQEPVRAGYQRRLASTPGVVCTVDSQVPNGLEIRTRALRPATLATALRKTITPVINTGCAPDGTELPDAMAVARVCRQLACGFYYRWVWPGEPDHDWLDARNAWNRVVRRTLARAAAPGFDSPLLLARAAQAGDGGPELTGAWADWAAVRERPEPPVEAVWLTAGVLADVARWVTEEPDGAIVWYEHRAVGERLAADYGLPHYGPGADASSATEPVLVCSIKAQGTGKNLQRYARNLVTTPPASGATWEQLLGRTHREGQVADTVTFDVYQHDACLASALEQARRDARYISESTGQPQKLELATWVDD